MIMAAFTVLVGPVDHDGARYAEGAQLDLSAVEAEPLVALGIIGEAVKKKRVEAEG